MNVSERKSVKALLSGISKFRATTWYDRYMDHLIYLKEDVSYRADRVDPALTLLWHPHEERLVGVKLKGIAGVFEDISSILVDHDHKDEFPLSEILKVVSVGLSYADNLDGVEHFRAAHWREKYAEAEMFVDDVTIPSDLSLIALAA